MATIGTFTKTSDGAYTGSIHTLSLNVKSAQFRPNEKSVPAAPDFRIFSGKAELGAAWKKSKADREYLKVKLDDPSFPATLWANLVEIEDGHALIWSRDRQAD